MVKSIGVRGQSPLIDIHWTHKESVSSETSLFFLEIIRTAIYWIHRDDWTRKGLLESSTRPSRSELLDRHAEQSLWHRVKERSYGRTALPNEGFIWIKCLFSNHITLPSFFCHRWKNNKEYPWNRMWILHSITVLPTNMEEDQSQLCGEQDLCVNLKQSVN